MLRKGRGHACGSAVRTEFPLAFDGKSSMDEVMNTISISRRDFARLLGAGAAAAVVRPSLSFAKQTQSVATPLAEGGIVRLSANENPYGPCPKAFQAITDSFSLACRYPDEHNNVLID